MREKLDFNKLDVLKQIIGCAREIYGNGIAVPGSNHPCGWDWIDFGNIEDIEGIENYRFESEDINNGGCDSEYEDMNLKEILRKTEGKFAFEVNCNSIDWYND